MKLRIYLGTENDSRHFKLFHYVPRRIKFPDSYAYNEFKLKLSQVAVTLLFLVSDSESVNFNVDICESKQK